ncbi:protein-L-isoaspartate O-methyltransferase [Methylocystis sp. B8]|uniref:protein-L-isoaspartate O-methyltransferase family protein n=1 Tax=Methylocystis sp. B8 TaxID=544938 RepID=UPI0010FED962|nr:protein-L-isoaspartate O-methyltransferase [Methylocystis sp. B8]TLG75190.1 protein-L-isoaspartate O-methyltransferase [Methylocystis sp. B8]
MLDKVTRVAKAREATATLRHTMVERQLRPFDVTDVPLLERFLSVPRELFLPDSLASLAYSDLAVSVKSAGGHKRSLLPPLVLARMLQEAEIKATEKALDIGGAGYSAALLSGLAEKVVALECDPELYARAEAGIDALNCENVQLALGPLEKGCPSNGPYDVIIVQGHAQAGLDALFEQLTPDGRLLAIVRPEPRAGQQVVRFERQEGRAAGERPLFSASAPVLEGFAQTPAFSL